MLRQSATSAVVQVIIAVILGRFVLPSVVDAGGAQGGGLGGAISIALLAWLIAAVLISAWLVASGPALARGTAQLLGRLVSLDGGSDSRPGVTRVGTSVAAGWIAALIDVVLIQAVLRQPVVAVFGTLTDPLTVDAAFAAGTLILLIVLLIWLHRTTRPLVEAATWQALDAIIATSGSERAQALAAEADTRLATSVSSTSRGVDTGGERTVRQGEAPETIAAASADVTRRAPDTAAVTLASDSTRAASTQTPTIAEGVATRATLPADATVVDSDRTRPG